MEREAKVVATALRKARAALLEKRGKANLLAANATSSRATSPTGSVRSTSSARSAFSARRLTANEQEARAANLRRRLTAQQNRSRIAAQKKNNAATRKLADAYKKLEGFDDDVLDAFCEELRQRRRGAAGATAAARSVVAAAAAANSSGNNNLNLR